MSLKAQPQRMWLPGHFFGHNRCVCHSKDVRREQIDSASWDDPRKMSWLECVPQSLCDKSMCVISLVMGCVGTR